MPPRTARLKTKTPIKKANPERRARRRKKYATFIRSPEWKAYRLKQFAYDGWRCTALRETRIAAPMDGCGDDWRRVERCAFTDDTRTGKGLVCDHLGYQRFGGQEIIGRDTRTLCKACDRRETRLHRANHAQGLSRAHVGQVHGTPTQRSA